MIEKSIGKVEQLNKVGNYDIEKLKSNISKLPEKTNEIKAKSPSRKNIEKLKSDVSKLPEKTNEIKVKSSSRKIEINKQEKFIKDVKNGKIKLENDNQKGNFGEMVTDKTMRDNGYKRISKERVTDLNDKGHHGIDGVYYDKKENKYIIAESKYGTSKLNENTLDGKQMSDKWTGQNEYWNTDNRLNMDVGDKKATDIRVSKILDESSVRKVLVNVDEKGNAKVNELNKNGDKYI